MSVLSSSSRASTPRTSLEASATSGTATAFASKLYSRASLVQGRPRAAQPAAAAASSSSSSWHWRPQRLPVAAGQGSARPVAPCQAAYSSFSSFSSFSSMDSGDESDGDFNGNVPWGKLWVAGVVDYYAVLQVDDDAPTEEIKKAYRALAKQCHPDFLGDEGHNICILLNEAYQVLSDPSSRQKYNARLEQALKDDEDDYTGKPLSKWMPSVKPAMAKNKDPNERRAVFVSENDCIGCKQCVWHACATFRMEQEHGRSRVFAQWLDDEEHIQAAIDSCPVNCIHWVDKDQLPALEYVMQKRMTQRVNVGMMMAGQGATSDVWSATESFLKERRRLQEAQERASKQRAYSPAQEQARKAATNALRKKSLGVFAKFGEMFDNIAEQLQSTVTGTPEDMVQVGKRKRAVRWDQAERAARAASGRDYFLVPPERALVPVTVRSDL